MLIGFAVLASTLGAAAAQAPTPGPVSAGALVEKLQAAGLEVAGPVAMARADYGKAPFVCKGMKFVVPATEPTAYGRAFYCARKTDADRLEKYYTSLGAAVHVLVQRPFVLVLDGALPAETVAAYRAALPTVAGGSVAAPPVQSISVTVERMGYMWWGRPYFMYDPSQPCMSTDNSHSVLMLQTSVAITNYSRTQTMQVGSWRMRFYRLNGEPAATCNYTARGRVTKEPLKNDWDRAAATRAAEDTLEGRELFGIPPGGTARLVYAVFVESNDRVAYGEVTDAVLGTSNRIMVPLTLTVPTR
jgi:hypothetical protein